MAAQAAWLSALAAGACLSLVAFAVPWGGTGLGAFASAPPRVMTAAATAAMLQAAALPLVAVLAVLLARRARDEERHLRGAFGTEWARYCAVTRRRIVPLVY